MLAESELTSPVPADSCGLRSGPETQNTTANVKTQKCKCDRAAAEKYR